MACTCSRPPWLWAPGCEWERSSIISPFAFGTVFELLEARSAIDISAFEPVRLARDEPHRLVRVAVEMLHHQPLGAQRQVDHVAFLPLVLDPVHQGIASAFQDHDHLSALELDPAGAAARRNLL